MVYVPDSSMLHPSSEENIPVTGRRLRWIERTNEGAGHGPGYSFLPVDPQIINDVYLAAKAVPVGTKFKFPVDMKKRLRSLGSTPLYEEKPPVPLFHRHEHRVYLGIGFDHTWINSVDMLQALRQYLLDNSWYFRSMENGHVVSGTVRDFIRTAERYIAALESQTTHGLQPEAGEGTTPFSYRDNLTNLSIDTSLYGDVDTRGPTPRYHRDVPDRRTIVSDRPTLIRLHETPNGQLLLDEEVGVTNPVEIHADPWVPTAFVPSDIDHAAHILREGLQRDVIKMTHDTSWRLEL